MSSTYSFEASFHHELDYVIFYKQKRLPIGDLIGFYLKNKGKNHRARELKRDLSSEAL